MEWVIVVERHVIISEYLFVFRVIPIIHWKNNRVDIADVCQTIYLIYLQISKSKRFSNKKKQQ